MNFNVTGKLTNSGGGAVVPIGTVLDFAGANPPNTIWYVMDKKYHELSMQNYLL